MSPAASSLQPQALKVRLDLAYNGTRFRGFAENVDVRTVAGELRAALKRILGDAPRLSVAGRTDAGVHASAQVVSFELDAGQVGASPGGASPDGASPDMAQLRNRLNRLVGPEIAVLAATEVSPNFDARHCAKSRSYCYQIRNAATADPLLNHRQWHVASQLDLAAMNAAARHLLGEHDFTSFCRQTDPPSSLSRHVLHALWTKTTSPTAQLLEFHITAKAFCHQMVRSVVGLCVAVGQGRCAASDVPRILAAQDRNSAPPIAPPQGLTLVDVRY